MSKVIKMVSLVPAASWSILWQKDFLSIFFVTHYIVITSQHKQTTFGKKLANFLGLYYFYFYLFHPHTWHLVMIYPPVQYFDATNFQRLKFGKKTILKLIKSCRQ